MNLSDLSVDDAERLEFPVLAGVENPEPVVPPVQPGELRVQIAQASQAPTGDSLSSGGVLHLLAGTVLVPGNSVLGRFEEQRPGWVDGR